MENTIKMEQSSRNNDNANEEKGTCLAKSQTELAIFNWYKGYYWPEMATVMTTSIIFYVLYQKQKKNKLHLY